MAELDRVKERIGWLKVVFAVLMATDITLLGWLAQNYNMASDFQSLMAFVAVIVVTAGVVWINRSLSSSLTNWENFNGVGARSSAVGFPYRDRSDSPRNRRA